MNSCVKDILQDDFWIMPQTPEYIEEGIPYITSKNIKNGKIDFSKVNYISQEAFEKISKNRPILVGDILISMIGTLGETTEVTVNDGAFYGQNMFLVRLDESKVDKRYFLNYFKSNYVKRALAEKQNQSTQKYLKANHIEDLYIPVPTVEQQRNIACILDKISEIINSRKQQLQQLDDLVKARFVEMFGETGKQVLLTDYVWFQEGPGVRSVDFTSEGTILLTGSNINDNEISFGYKSDRHISSELSSGKYAHFMCDKDDILVVSSAIAPDKFDKKVVVVDVDKKYCLNTGIIRFKPNKQYLTLGYFREFLKTDYFKRQVSSEMRGIAQMHFGPSHLKQMTILLPSSLERQIEFESFVEQVDKSKVAVQKALDEAQTLFDSLMQEYFG